MKKRKLTTVKRELDTVFSKYIRLRDSIDGIVGACKTCNKIQDISQMDAGHFMSRRFMSTRWNEKNVHLQCKYCNNWGAGEQFKMGKYIDKVYGSGTANNLEEMSKIPTKLNVVDLELRIKYYKDLLKSS